MRTLGLFILTFAGIVAIAEDASAFGRKTRRADPCVNCDVSLVEVSSDGTSGAYSTGYSGGSPYVSPGPSSTSYRYYPNGGIWPSGYNASVYPGSGIIPAPGLLDAKTATPIAPRTVPNPMPNKDK